MSDRNVKICRILEYKINKIRGTLFRILHLILLNLTSQPWKLLTYGFATLRLVGSQVATRRVVNLQPVALQVATRWFIAMWSAHNSLARDSPFVGLQLSNTLGKYINPSKTGLFEGSCLLTRAIWTTPSPPFIFQKELHNLISI